jgi:hypothetical protein
MKLKNECMHACKEEIAVKEERKRKREQGKIKMGRRNKAECPFWLVTWIMPCIVHSFSANK